MEQTTIFDNDQPCIRCQTIFCRLHPCTQAQGVKCCCQCPYYKSCKTEKCACLTSRVE